MTKLVGNEATVKADWQRALADAVARRADIVSPGWITLQEFARLVGKGSSAARQDIQLLIANTKAEKKSFRVISGGRLMLVPYYKLKK